MNHKNWFRAITLFVLMLSFIPTSGVSAQPVSAAPPADFFQLPWDQGVAWVAIDGIDNGTKRPLSSSHHFSVGGAIDFAPRSNMVKGENTSNFWTAAAGDGIVVGISKCHIIIDHRNGWITQYQFLANIQVHLGDNVTRNQRLGIIADGVRNPFCPGSVDPNVPHLHFMLRPTIVGATFAGWTVNYLPVLNKTTFTKNGQTVGLFKPLLNVFDVPSTPTPTITSTTAPGSETPSATPSSTPDMSPTPTLFGPYVSTTIIPQAINVGEKALVTVSLNNVPVEGYTSAEFTCTYNANLFEVSNITIANLFGADPATAISGPQAQSLIVAIAGSNGNKATTSGPAFTFDVTGLQVGQTVIECRARVSQGNNVLTEIPFAVDYITILGSTPTVNLTPSDTPAPTQTPEPSTPTVTETSSPGFPTQPPASQTAMPTVPVDWLTFTNSTFGFQFQYPPQGQIQVGSNDGDTRINNLPIVQPGTNLTRKFMEVFAGQNVTECKSPLPTQDPGQMVTINGISFLKQTGLEGAAGSTFQSVVYSTLRDGVCVNLGFVLQSHDPSSFPTPPPVFDYATETALFDQIVTTYTWLVVPTATPTGTLSPAESETPTVTPTSSFSTPAESPTLTSTPSLSPTPSGNNGAVAGQILASKPVTVNVYDSNSTLVGTIETDVDGRFRLEVSPGTYTVVAVESGFLSAQGSATLTTGNTIILPPITLLAGDIDGNDVIDQFDALTIGMNYNATSPEAADLNNDGIINVLDLELLAQNYRKTGPTDWQ